MTNFVYNENILSSYILLIYALTLSIIILSGGWQKQSYYIMYVC